MPILCLDLSNTDDSSDDDSSDSSSSSRDEEGEGKIVIEGSRDSQVTNSCSINRANDGARSETSQASEAEKDRMKLKDEQIASLKQVTNLKIENNDDDDDSSSSSSDDDEGEIEIVGYYDARLTKGSTASKAKETAFHDKIEKNETYVGTIESVNSSETQIPKKKVSQISNDHVKPRCKSIDCVDTEKDSKNEDKKREATGKEKPVNLARPRHDANGKYDANMFEKFDTSSKKRLLLEARAESHINAEQGANHEGAQRSLVGNVEQKAKSNNTMSQKVDSRKPQASGPNLSETERLSETTSGTDHGNASSAGKKSKDFQADEGKTLSAKIEGARRSDASNETSKNTMQSRSGLELSKWRTRSFSSGALCVIGPDTKVVSSKGNVVGGTRCSEDQCKQINVSIIQVNINENKASLDPIIEKAYQGMKKASSAGISKTQGNKATTLSTGKCDSRGNNFLEKAFRGKADNITFSQLARNQGKNEFSKAAIAIGPTGQTARSSQLFYKGKYDSASLQMTRLVEARDKRIFDSNNIFSGTYNEGNLSYRLSNEQESGQKCTKSKKNEFIKNSHDAKPCTTRNDDGVRSNRPREKAMLSNDLITPGSKTIIPRSLQSASKGAAVDVTSEISNNFKKTPGNDIILKNSKSSSFVPILPMPKPTAPSKTTLARQVTSQDRKSPYSIIHGKPSSGFAATPCVNGNPAHSFSHNGASDKKTWNSPDKSFRPTYQFGKKSLSIEKASTNSIFGCSAMSKKPLPTFKDFSQKSSAVFGAPFSKLSFEIARNGASTLPRNTSSLPILAQPEKEIVSAHTPKIPIHQSGLRILSECAGSISGETKDERSKIYMPTNLNAPSSKPNSNTNYSFSALARNDEKKRHSQSFDRATVAVRSLNSVPLPSRKSLPETVQQMASNQYLRDDAKPDFPNTSFSDFARSGKKNRPSHRDEGQHSAQSLKSTAMFSRKSPPESAKQKPSCYPEPSFLSSSASGETTKARPVSNIFEVKKGRAGHGFHGNVPPSGITRVATQNSGQAPGSEPKSGAQKKDTNSTAKNDGLEQNQMSTTQKESSGFKTRLESSYKLKAPVLSDVFEVPPAKDTGSAKEKSATDKMFTANVTERVDKAEKRNMNARIAPFNLNREPGAVLNTAARIDVVDLTSSPPLTTAKCIAATKYSTKNGESRKNGVIEGAHRNASSRSASIKDPSLGTASEPDTTLKFFNCKDSVPLGSVKAPAGEKKSNTKDIQSIITKSLRPSSEPGATLKCSNCVDSVTLESIKAPTGTTSGSGGTLKSSNFVASVNLGSFKAPAGQKESTTKCSQSITAKDVTRNETKKGGLLLSNESTRQGVERSGDDTQSINESIEPPYKRLGLNAALKPVVRVDANGSTCDQTSAAAENKTNNEVEVPKDGSQENTHNCTKAQVVGRNTSTKKCQSLSTKNDSNTDLCHDGSPKSTELGPCSDAIIEPTVACAKVKKISQSVEKEKGQLPENINNECKGSTRQKANKQQPHSYTKTLCSEKVSEKNVLNAGHTSFAEAFATKKGTNSNNPKERKTEDALVAEQCKNASLTFGARECKDSSHAFAAEHERNRIVKNETKGEKKGIDKDQEKSKKESKLRLTEVKKSNVELTDHRDTDLLQQSTAEGDAKSNKLENIPTKGAIAVNQCRNSLHSSAAEQERDPTKKKVSNFVEKSSGKLPENYGNDQKNVENGSNFGSLDAKKRNAGHADSTVKNSAQLSTPKGGLNTKSSEDKEIREIFNVQQSEALSHSSAAEEGKDVALKMTSQTLEDGKDILLENAKKGSHDPIRYEENCHQGKKSTFWSSLKKASKFVVIGAKKRNLGSTDFTDTGSAQAIAAEVVTNPKTALHINAAEQGLDVANNNLASNVGKSLQMLTQNVVNELTLPAQQVDTKQSEDKGVEASSLHNISEQNVPGAKKRKHGLIEVGDTAPVKVVAAKGSGIANSSQYTATQVTIVIDKNNDALPGGSNKLGQGLAQNNEFQKETDTGNTKSQSVASKDICQSKPSIHGSTKRSDQPTVEKSAPDKKKMEIRDNVSSRSSSDKVQGSDQNGDSEKQTHESHDLPCSQKLAESHGSQKCVKSLNAPDSNLVQEFSKGSVLVERANEGTPKTDSNQAKDDEGTYQATDDAACLPISSESNFCSSDERGNKTSKLRESPQCDVDHQDKAPPAISTFAISKASLSDDADSILSPCRLGDETDEMNISYSMDDNEEEDGPIVELEDNLGALLEAEAKMSEEDETSDSKAAANSLLHPSRTKQILDLTVAPGTRKFDSRLVLNKLSAIMRKTKPKKLGQTLVSEPDSNFDKKVNALDQRTTLLSDEHKDEKLPRKVHSVAYAQNLASKGDNCNVHDTQKSEDKPGTADEGEDANIGLQSPPSVQPAVDKWLSSIERKSVDARTTGSHRRVTWKDDHIGSKEESISGEEARNIDDEKAQSTEEDDVTFLKVAPSRKRKVESQKDTENPKQLPKNQKLSHVKEDPKEINLQTKNTSTPPAKRSKNVEPKTEVPTKKGAATNPHTVHKAKTRHKQQMSQKTHFLKMGQDEVARLRLIPRKERTKDDKTRLKTVLHGIKQYKSGGTIDMLVQALGQNQKRSNRRKSHGKVDYCEI